MFLLRIILTVTDLLTMAALAYFLQPLRWERSKDRASIVGFWYMLGTIFLTVVVMWVR